jgi:hypothetical protein
MDPSQADHSPATPSRRISRSRPDQGRLVQYRWFVKEPRLDRLRQQQMYENSIAALLCSCLIQVHITPARILNVPPALKTAEKRDIYRKHRAEWLSFRKD